MFRLLRKNYAQIEYDEILKMAVLVQTLRARLDILAQFLVPVVRDKYQPTKQDEAHIKDIIRAITDELSKLNKEAKDILVEELRRERVK